jgi:membrane protease YdiL (CAAX protease family)
MNTLFSFVKRHPIIMFAAFTYLLSWWSIPFSGGRILPYGPALAAVIVLAITAGRPGLRALWKRVAHWQVAWYWYLIGPGIIASYQSLAFALNLLFGATVVNSPQLPDYGTIITLLLLGGLWEEPGWTGYALPKLQERFANRSNGSLLAALGVGLMRAVWHIPLFIYGHIPWFDVVLFEITIQLIIAWLFNRSGGSVLVVMWFHFISNIAGVVVGPATFAGAGWMSYYALFVALAVLIALGILWVSRFKLGQSGVKKEFIAVQ